MSLIRVGHSLGHLLLVGAKHDRGRGHALLADAEGQPRVRRADGDDREEGARDLLRLEMCHRQE